MPGETDLATLLAGLDPTMDVGLYTFATVAPGETVDTAEVVGTFREAEGLSIICPLAVARAHRLRHDGEFRRITLNVHSSLHAVGLTARVASGLPERGIACNIVAAFFHDHVFVPADRAKEACHLLRHLR